MELLARGDLKRLAALEVHPDLYGKDLADPVALAGIEPLANGHGGVDDAPILILLTQKILQPGSFGLVVQSVAFQKLQVAAVVLAKATPGQAVSDGAGRRADARPGRHRRADHQRDPAAEVGAAARFEKRVKHPAHILGPRTRELVEPRREDVRRGEAAIALIQGGQRPDAVAGRFAVVERDEDDVLVVARLGGDGHGAAQRALEHQ